MSSIFKGWAIGGAVLALAGPLQAALINYDPRAGATVNFVSISESSIEQTTPGNGLFNQPIVGGDTLLFEEMNFRAQSTGPQRDLDYLDSLDADLDVTIQAKPQHVLTTLSLSQVGFYNLDQSVVLPGKAYAKAEVMTFTIQVLERNGVPIPPVSIQISPGFTWDADNEFFLNVDGFDDTTPASGSFSGSGVVDLVAASGFDDITRIAFSITNYLKAESVPNASATIRIDELLLGVGSTVVVPEPAAITLLGGVACALLSRRRMHRV